MTTLITISLIVLGSVFLAATLVGALIVAIVLFIIKNI